MNNQFQRFSCELYFCWCNGRVRFYRSAVINMPFGPQMVYKWAWRKRTTDFKNKSVPAPVFSPQTPQNTLDANPGPHGKKSATDCLSYSEAQLNYPENTLKINTNTSHCRGQPNSRASRFQGSCITQWFSNSPSCTEPVHHSVQRSVPHRLLFLSNAGVWRPCDTNFVFTVTVACKTESNQTTCSSWFQLVQLRTEPKVRAVSDWWSRNRL